MRNEQRGLFNRDNERSNKLRKTWNGLYLYAVDGIQLTLPKSKDIVEADYSGRKVTKYLESYMPKMFSTMAFDVLNGVVKDVRENPTLNEIADAASMIEKFEDNSLAIYDRLYCCRKLTLKYDVAKQSLQETYRKPNFKLLFGWVMSRFYKIFKGVRGVMKDVDELLVRSLEKRKRRSRSYKREIKSPQSPFPHKNTAWYGLN